MTGNLAWVPPTWVYWLLGALLSALGSLGGYMIKRAIESIKKDWQTAIAQLQIIENTTRVQAENHLCTIQAESIKQTALLSEMIKEQSETNGYLRAVVDMSKRSAGN